ncbi:unknown [Clostridium sp. CAG:780]|nr:unknown [Clostridium sp. CAG:780]
MPPPPPAPPPPPVAPPPPAPMINISDVKGTIGEVRKGEVVKARETLERTTNKEKSTEEREI